MELQYLGTAASEGMPALFCNCPVCRDCAVSGGKNIRRRACCMLDGELMLDFGPDAYAQMLEFGLDYRSLRHLLVTHSHADHITPETLSYRRRPFSNYGETPIILNVYCNETVDSLIWNRIERPDIMKNYLSTNVIKPFDEFAAGDYSVTALRALHRRDEECLLYLVEKDGKRLLYANDTGIFPDDTFKRLSGIKLDIISFDCTFSFTAEGQNHMGLPDNVAVFERLKSLGCVRSGTKTVVTHFSHNGGVTHDIMEKEAAKYGFLTAYDGMKISV